MKKSTAAALGVGVLIALGIGGKFGVRYFADGAPDVAVRLTLDASKVCQPSIPGLLGGGYEDLVTWRVTNVDCPPQYIGITNFRPYKNGAPGKQDKKVIDPDPATGGPILTSATTPFLLTGEIRKYQWFSKQMFKYDILLGDTAGSLVVRLDPDIEIWP